MDRVKARYDEWERVLRDHIRKCEEQKAYASLEPAKALLLYGIKLYDDLINSNLSETDRLSFVNEMRRRTTLVLNHIIKNQQ